MATSAQLHIAIHKSAWAKAGESFIQSQTIATLYHSCCNFLTSDALFSGNTSAKTLSILTWFAIAFAVFLLSQVIMNTLIHIFLSLSIASLEVCFTVSATATNHMAIFVFAKIITVFHSLSRFSM